MDPRVRAAAANNARWCDLVCRSHALPTAMSDELWVAREGSPRFYPDAVTLAPGMTADAVLSGIDVRPGSAAKDSSDLPAAVAQTAGDLPVVGYQRGDALQAAVASGFSAIGPLRVWSTPAS